MTKQRNSFSKCMFLTVALTFSLVFGQAQQNEHYNVAIFLYPHVELLDFAGPGEVFASTPGFTVYTVSADGKELQSQGFVTVKPQYSLDDVPVPDIIVLPGGNTAETMKNPKVIEWINRRFATGSMVMSVCSGAGILAKAGLLTGLNVTTFHSYIPGLQAMLPHSKVLPNTRYVDNGMIITTAGVSAGIDGALHVVSRIKGMEVAKATAFYMEYDKWKPEEGRLDYQNEYLEKLKTKPGPLEKEKIKAVAITKEQIPFEGELKNLGLELLEAGSYREAATVLEETIRWYPNSASAYSQLARAYAKLGKPAPIDEKELLKIIDAGKVEEAWAVYEKTQKTYPGWKLFDENALNSAGYEFMRIEDYDHAIKVFQLNAKAYPNSFNVFDSLGEGLMKAGNKNEAIANYKKSLELNPENSNAKQMLAQLEGRM